MLKLLTVVALVAIAQCEEFRMDGTWSIVYVAGPDFAPMEHMFPVCQNLQVTKGTTTQRCGNYETFNVRTLWPGHAVVPRETYTEVNSFSEVIAFFNSTCGRSQTEKVNPFRHVGQNYYIIYSPMTPGDPSPLLDYLVMHRGTAPSKREVQRFIRMNAPEVIEGIALCYDPFMGASATAGTPDQTKANTESAKPILNKIKTQFFALNEVK